MEIAVERLTALVLLLTCLSHIAAPRAWHLLFERIRVGGETAGLANAAVHLPLGLMIVAFHNVWTWPEAVVTVIGWALLLKGTLHLLFPQLAQRTLNLPGEAKQAERRYRLAGALMLPLALTIGWIALR
ncbi:MAG TPA: hypothetical protein VJ597_07170 [Sphingomicrobium sp.]|nr:hypothetical protein [Sphingomicrobium sp.]